MMQYDAILINERIEKHIEERMKTIEFEIKLSIDFNMASLIRCTSILTSRTGTVEKRWNRFQDLSSSSPSSLLKRFSSNDYPRKEIITSWRGFKKLEIYLHYYENYKELQRIIYKYFWNEDKKLSKLDEFIEMSFSKKESKKENNIRNWRTNDVYFRH